MSQLDDHVDLIATNRETATQLRDIGEERAADSLTQLIAAYEAELGGQYRRAQGIADRIKEASKPLIDLGDPGYDWCPTHQKNDCDQHR